MKIQNYYNFLKILQKLYRQSDITDLKNTLEDQKAFMKTKLFEIFIIFTFLLIKCNGLNPFSQYELPVNSSISCIQYFPGLKILAVALNTTGIDLYSVSGNSIIYIKRITTTTRVNLMASAVNNSRLVFAQDYKVSCIDYSSQNQTYSSQFGQKIHQIFPNGTSIVVQTQTSYSSYVCSLTTSPTTSLACTITSLPFSGLATYFMKPNTHDDRQTAIAYNGQSRSMDIRVDNTYNPYTVNSSITDIVYYSNIYQALIFTDTQSVYRTSVPLNGTTYQDCRYMDLNISIFKQSVIDRQEQVFFYITQLGEVKGRNMQDLRLAYYIQIGNSVELQRLQANQDIVIRTGDGRLFFIWTVSYDNTNTIFENLQLCPDQSGIYPTKTTTNTTTTPTTTNTSSGTTSGTGTTNTTTTNTTTANSTNTTATNTTSTQTTNTTTPSSSTKTTSGTIGINPTTFQTNTTSTQITNSTNTTSTTTNTTDITRTNDTTTTPTTPINQTIPSTTNNTNSTTSNNTTNSTITNNTTTTNNTTPQLFNNNTTDFNKNNQSSQNFSAIIEDKQIIFVCQLNCDVCKNQLLCLKCKQGYQLTEQGTCQTSQSIDLFSTLISTPYSGVVMNFILMDFMEEFWFFQHHNFNYTHNIQRIFSLVGSLNRNKIVPPVFKYLIKDTVSNINTRTISPSNFIQYTPISFQKAQNTDAYFISNVSGMFIWAYALILFMFAFTHFGHSILSKIFGSDMLQKFSSKAILFYLLFSPFIQYISFHSFSQLKLLFSFNAADKVNLVITILFLGINMFFVFAGFPIFYYLNSLKLSKIVYSQENTLKGYIRSLFIWSGKLFYLGFINGYLQTFFVQCFNLLVLYAIQIWLLKKQISIKQKNSLIRAPVFFKFIMKILSFLFVLFSLALTLNIGQKSLLQPNQQISIVGIWTWALAQILFRVVEIVLIGNKTLKSKIHSLIAKSNQKSKSTHSIDKNIIKSEKSVKFENRHKNTQINVSDMLDDKASEQKTIKTGFGQRSQRLGRTKITKFKLKTKRNAYPINQLVKQVQ